MVYDYGGLFCDLILGAGGPDGPEGDLPGGLHGVELDGVGPPVQIHLQDGARAEHGVLHPLPRGEAAGLVRLGQMPQAVVDVAPGVPDEPLLGLLGEGEQAGVDVQQEPGGVAGGAVKVPSVRLGQVEAPLRPGEGHKGQPPLLLHPREGAHLPGGEDPLVHPAQEHVGELQPLSGVDGHQLHLVPRLPGVGVGEQGHVGEIVLQGALLAAGGLILIDRLLQLGQIVQPVLASLGAEHHLVAALVEYGGQHL